MKANFFGMIGGASIIAGALVYGTEMGQRNERFYLQASGEHVLRIDRQTGDVWSGTYYSGSAAYGLNPGWRFKKVEADW